MGIKEMISQVNVTKLDGELRAAGIPIDGVADIDGTKAHVRIDFQATATDVQKDQAAQIVAAHNPVDTDQEARLARLAQARSDAQGVVLDTSTPAQTPVALAAEVVNLKKIVLLLQAELDVLKHRNLSA